MNAGGLVVIGDDGQRLRQRRGGPLAEQPRNVRRQRRRDKLGQASVQGLRAGAVEALQIQQDLHVFEARRACGCDGDEEISRRVFARDAGLLGDEVCGNLLATDSGVQVPGGDDEFEGLGLGAEVVEHEVDGSEQLGERAACGVFESPATPILKPFVGLGGCVGFDGGRGGGLIDPRLEFRRKARWLLDAGAGNANRNVTRCDIGIDVEWACIVEQPLDPGVDAVLSNRLRLGTHRLAQELKQTAYAIA